MRKSLFIGLLALSSTMIFAQNQEQRIKEPEKITFKPHWFIQAQIGAAHTIGEAKFTDLVSLLLLLSTWVISLLLHLVHVLV